MRPRLKVHDGWLLISVIATGVSTLPACTGEHPLIFGYIWAGLALFFWIVYEISGRILRWM